MRSRLILAVLAALVVLLVPLASAHDGSGPHTHPPVDPPGWVKWAALLIASIVFSIALFVVRVARATPSLSGDDEASRLQATLGVAPSGAAAAPTAYELSALRASRGQPDAAAGAVEGGAGTGGEALQRSAEQIKRAERHMDRMEAEAARSAATLERIEEQLARLVNAVEER